MASARKFPKGSRRGACFTTFGGVDDFDLSVRQATYGLFVELGKAPSVEEVARRLSASVEDVEAGWARLDEAHALVLHANGKLRMANPFSAVPTAYRVEAGGRHWYANCAWDAFGICAALHSDGIVATSCPDCGFPLTVTLHARKPDDDSLLFHCLVPASAWWDDITFT
jgi:hypothetical protein